MKITDGFVVCGVTSQEGDLGPICQFPTLQEAADWLKEFWDDPENSGTLHPRYQPALYRIAEYQGGVRMDEYELETSGALTQWP